MLSKGTGAKQKETERIKSRLIKYHTWMVHRIWVIVLQTSKAKEGKIVKVLYGRCWEDTRRSRDEVFITPVE